MILDWRGQGVIIPSEEQGEPDIPVTNVEEVSSAGEHTCILTRIEQGDNVSSIVRCWGRNHLGQIGNGDNVDQPNPVAVVTSSSETTPLANVRQISAGLTHSCALVGEDGQVSAGRAMTVASLGTIPQRTPMYLSAVLTSGTNNPPLEGVAEVRAGAGFTCARMSVDGAIQCWGVGPNLGNNAASNASDSLLPVGVELEGTDGDGDTTSEPFTGATSLTLGHNHGCAILGTEGRGICWGSNQDGRGGIGDETRVHLGSANFVQTSSADDSVPLEGIVNIKAGANFTCAILQDGLLQCWGNGVNGILGDGRNPEDNASAPVTILSEAEGEPFRTF